LALFLSTEKGFNTASMPVSASFDRKEACQNQDSLRSSVVLKVSSSSNFGKRKLKFTSFLNQEAMCPVLLDPAQQENGQANPLKRFQILQTVRIVLQCNLRIEQGRTCV
jgi:hypothetical protein